MINKYDSHINEVVNIPLPVIHRKDVPDGTSFLCILYYSLVLKDASYETEVQSRIYRDAGDYFDDVAAVTTSMLFCQALVLVCAGFLIICRGIYLWRAPELDAKVELAAYALLAGNCTAKADTQVGTERVYFDSSFHITVVCRIGCNEVVAQLCTNHSLVFNVLARSRRQTCRIVYGIVPLCDRR